MSGKIFECGYGAIVREDADVLEDCLIRCIAPDAGKDPHNQLGCLRGSIRVLEIGMHDGGTARGIDVFVKERGCMLDYIGIDPDDGTMRPRFVPKIGRVIVGDSAEVFGQVEPDLDLVWVDGCHCLNHVILDTIHYAPKVRAGGFLCFHDVNPRIQGEEKQLHGPDLPIFQVSVLVALDKIGFPWPGWELWREAIPSDIPGCGTRAYRKGYG